MTNHLCGLQKFFLDAGEGDEDEDAAENGDQDADTSIGQRLDLKIYGSTLLCGIGSLVLFWQYR